ncbi:hypothetical protein ZWY2020_019158 [Hordeum vulgare]|nr:hypothetical protein ZWY2020_019158 [Hordeum vulgare]
MATTHPDLHSSTMASHYCNYPSVARRISALPPARLKYVKSGCFKDVIAMLVDKHSEELNYIKKVEVDRFDPSTRELDLLSGTKIRLTSQSPNLLKLSSGPYQLKQHLLETDSGDLNEQISYVKDLYKFDLSGYKKSLLSELWAELASAESKMTDAEFYIKFTLAFVSSFVAPVAFTKVNLDILGDIIPFERIDTLDWDGFSIDQLAAGVQELKKGRLKVLKGCAYLIIMGDKLFRRMEGVNSQPRCSNLLVHAGTNSGPFSDSTAVSNLESMSSPAMDDHGLLAKELHERLVLLERIKDLVEESPGLEVEQGYEARSVHHNENEGYQHTDIALPNEDAGRDGDEAAYPAGDAMEEDQEHSADQAAQPLVDILEENEAAYPPEDTMEEDQEPSADQGGNNASVDAGNVAGPAAQPPASFVAAPQGQIHLDDNHGNNQPLLGAAAGEGNEDAGREVIQAAHQHSSVKGRGHRKKIPSMILHRSDFIKEGVTNGPYIGEGLRRKFVEIEIFLPETSASSAAGSRRLPPS